MAANQRKVSKEIMHPILEPQFERMNSLNPPSLHSLKAPVVWNGDVHALGRDYDYTNRIIDRSNRSSNGKLFKYSLSSNEWSQISIDSSIYVSGCVLTTYRSKLLLISGRDDMIVWEFSNNEFKRSCIKPVPSKFCKLVMTNVVTTSTDKDLIIVSFSWPDRGFCLVQLIYDGTDWRFRQYYESTSSSSGIGESTQYLLGGHTVFSITSYYGVVKYIAKASIHTLHEDDVEFGTFRDLNWVDYDVISCPEFNESVDLDLHVYGSKHFVILHNQQLYFIDPQGEIFISFIQSPIVPVIWGNCGVKFLHTPYFVGLPDGTMLIIGMIGKNDPQIEPCAELDVIKVSQKAIQFNPKNRLTMRDLVTLEWGMNVPVLTKIQSMLNNTKDIMTTGFIFDYRCKMMTFYESDDSIISESDEETISESDEEPISSVIKYIESLISSTSTDDVPEPTWNNFFKILKDTSPELGQLAYQIRKVFQATEAAEDAAKLKADLVQFQGSSKSAKEMERELESSVALCDSILQKIQKINEERELLEKQLQSKTEKVTKLNEELKLLKQTEKQIEAKKLSERDLPSVMRELKKHAAKWKEIGLHLGFLPGELDNIEAKPSLSQGAPVSWFGAMLQEWLQWAPMDRRGSTSFATLNDLKVALGETGLGASAHDLTLQNVRVASSVQLQLKNEEIGTPVDYTQSEEVEDNHTPLLVCNDDQQHSNNAASSLDTRLSSPEKGENQCLLQ